jgi:hypothetical protein
MDNPCPLLPSPVIFRKQQLQRIKETILTKILDGNVPDEKLFHSYTLKLFLDLGEFSVNQLMFSVILEIILSLSSISSRFERNERKKCLLTFLAQVPKESLKLIDDNGKNLLQHLIDQLEYDLDLAVKIISLVPSIVGDKSNPNDWSVFHEVILQAEVNYELVLYILITFPPSAK